MNKIIQQRIASHATRDYIVEVGDETVQAEIAVCLAISRSTRPMTQYLIQDSLPVEVRDWLRELPVDMQAEVSVLWPAMHSGVSTRFHTFIGIYDDLWYPGSDDIWVRPASGAWLLELDHEEVIRFFAAASG